MYKRQTKNNTKANDEPAKALIAELEKAAAAGCTAVSYTHLDGTLCMVRQFRYAMQPELWELPAGKLEKGEDPFEAAKREMEEECGLTAAKYTSLGEFLSLIPILRLRLIPAPL